MSPAEHNKALRQKRKAEGLSEVRLWLSPANISRLGRLAEAHKTTRVGVVSMLLLSAS